MRRRPLVLAGVLGLSSADVATVGAPATELRHSLAISNKVYGSLGAIAAFMFFVYLAAMVFLFGAEIASDTPAAR